MKCDLNLKTLGPEREMTQNFKKKKLLMSIVTYLCITKVKEFYGFSVSYLWVSFW